jgi:hypothetical protein
MVCTIKVRDLEIETARSLTVLLFRLSGCAALYACYLTRGGREVSDIVYNFEKRDHA